MAQGAGRMAQWPYSPAHGCVFHALLQVHGHRLLAARDGGCARCMDVQAHARTHTCMHAHARAHAHKCACPYAHAGPPRRPSTQALFSAAAARPSPAFTAEQAAQLGAWAAEARAYVEGEGSSSSSAADPAAPPLPPPADDPIMQLLQLVQVRTGRCSTHAHAWRRTARVAWRIRLSVALPHTQSP